LDIARYLIYVAKGVLWRNAPGFSAAIYSRFLRLHRDVRPIISRLSGIHRCDLIPFHLYFFERMAMNHCVLFLLSRDALRSDSRGLWMSGYKARAGRNVRHLIREEERELIQQVYDFGLALTQDWAAAAPTSIRDDFFLFHSQNSHELRSNSLIYRKTRVVPFSVHLSQYFQRCSQTTGVCFNNVDTRNLRITSIQRFLVEEKYDLWRTALRAGKLSPNSLLPYLRGAEVAQSRREIRRLNALAETLYDEASLHFNVRSHVWPNLPLANLVDCSTPIAEEGNHVLRP